MSLLKIQKREYLWNEGGIQKGNAILLCFGGPFRSAAVIFYFIGTLKTNITMKFQDYLS